MPVDVGANQSAAVHGLCAARLARARVHGPAARSKRPAGRRVPSQDTVMPQAPESIMPDETLILTLGRPQGVETIAELPGFQSARPGAVPATRRRRDRHGPDRRPGGIDARAAGTATTRRGPSSSTPATARRWRRSTRCAASRWSTGSSGAAIWWSPSVPTGRRCATASWRRSCRACPAVRRRWLRSRRSIPSPARPSRSLRPARRR